MKRKQDNDTKNFLQTLYKKFMLLRLLYNLVALYSLQDKIYTG